jgi:type II secretion system protein N
MFAACGHDSTKPSDPAPAVAPKPATPEAKPFLVIDQPLDQWFGANAPITGGLVMRGRLASATNQLSTATGTVSVSCDACTLGNGGKVVPLVKNEKTKAFAGDGITIPPIPLGQVSGTATFNDGNGVIDGHLGSPELFELTAKGTIKLADQFADSDVDVHLAFRTGKSLEDKPRAIIQTTGANMDDAGWFHIHLIGKFSDMKRRAEP